MSVDCEKVFSDFCKSNLKTTITGRLEYRSGANIALYMLPEGIPELSGLRVARSGWYLGDIKGRNTPRFEPSHAFALGLKAVEVQAACNLPPDLCTRYLRGESFDLSEVSDEISGSSEITGSSEISTSGEAKSLANRSWVLMCFAGHPLGWAHLVRGRLKNKYPQGWMTP